MPKKARKPRKLRFTANLDEPVIESVRNVVAQLCGPPLYLTLSGLVQNALAAEVKRLERRHNKGKPFPQRKRPLKAGRPRTA